MDRKAEYIADCGKIIYEHEVESTLASGVPLGEILKRLISGKGKGQVLRKAPQKSGLPRKERAAYPKELLQEAQANGITKAQFYTRVSRGMDPQEAAAVPCARRANGKETEE